MTAAQFKATRIRLGLTQREVAEAWGVSEQAIRNKEAGRSPVLGRDEIALRALEMHKFGSPKKRLDK